MNLQSPIGKFITLSYEEPSILDNPELVDKLSGLVETIKNKAIQRGVFETSEIIKNQLFEIRMELILYLISKPNIKDIFENKVLEQVLNFYAVKGPHENLGKVTSDSLEIYYKVLTQFPMEILEDLSIGNTNTKPEFSNFESLKNLLLFQPFPGNQIIITWLEASLKFDFSLIVSDLLIEEEILLSFSEEKNLIKLLSHSIIDFASSAAAGRFWDFPPEKIPFGDEIKVRTIELLANSTQTNKKTTAKFFSGIWTKEDATVIEKVIREGTEQIDEDGWE